MPGANKALYSQWQNNTHETWYKDPGLKRVGLICFVCYFGIFTSPSHSAHAPPALPARRG